VRLASWGSALVHPEPPPARRTSDLALETMTLSPTTLRRMPAKPFFFNTSAPLLRITRYKAHTLAELLDALRERPEHSIFRHTFRTLEEHHFPRAGFSNDFAHWVLTACNEPRLAEVLAGVGVREFTSGAELRARFIEVLEGYLRKSPESGARVADETLYFCASDTVVMPTSFQARTMQEFPKGIRTLSVHSIH